MASMIPEGYEEVALSPGFFRHCSSFYFHAEQSVLATRNTDKQLNPLRTAHGSFLATLADSAFGMVIKR